MYVYAHNNSRFDGVAVIHSILASSTDPLEDFLVSNGKFISFKWQNLIFRDSMLIAMSSLDAAAKAYGVEESKGYLPHSYIQNCTTLTEILERLNNPVSWRTMEPYMDWFHAVSTEDLQKRETGRSFEDWREEQPLHKEFHRHVEKGDMYNFKELLEKYLDKDVTCLFLLIEIMGNHFWKAYRANICMKSTVGSLAEHIWRHTLPKDIPKLLTEAKHKLWQFVNRGGFCGPLCTFDTTVPLDGSSTRSISAAYTRQPAD